MQMRFWHFGTESQEERQGLLTIAANRAKRFLLFCLMRINAFARCVAIYKKIASSFYFAVIFCPHVTINISFVKINSLCVYMHDKINKKV